jgi:hypothetical protein
MGRRRKTVAGRRQTRCLGQGQSRRQVTGRGPGHTPRHAVRTASCFTHIATARPRPCARGARSAVSGWFAGKDNMAKKMLIDATHPEETRVVVVDGTKVEEFDFESLSKRQDDTEEDIRPAAQAAPAPLQDPGSHQGPPDHAGAGRQGRARQQGRGADHLSQPRGPLLRADAQHRARRRHLPQDHQRRRPQEAQGDRARSTCRRARA